MSDTVSFLKKKFSEYYKQVDLFLPERFGRREWGFMFLGENFMKRHLAFQNVEDIKRFLVSKIPAHVYHSAAYYETPGASTMAEKNWLGADLIFDLDADHIKGAKTMTYEETLDRVKEEFVRLIDDFLLGDFGFSEDQLEIVFSGGRGYHIHIRDPKVLPLSSHERREIVDYITGRDVDMEWVFEEEPFDKRAYGSHVKVMHRVLMPKKETGGWKRKMREGLFNLIGELEKMEKKEAKRRLQAFEGIGEKTAEGIYSDLFEGERGKRGVDRMRDEENIEIFSQDKLRDSFLEIIKGEVSIKMEGDAELKLEPAETLSVKDRMEGETDEPVTSDVRRLIRLPSSLHGKTGFVVTPLSREKLDDFSPLRDAISRTFSDNPIEVDVKNHIKIRLKGEDFDLGKGKCKVPEYAAVFLMCRKIAEIA